MSQRPPLDALIHQPGCEPARSNFRDIIDDVCAPPARRLNNEHLKAKAARVLTMQPGGNRRFPERISDATTGHIRRNRPRALMRHRLIDVSRDQDDTSKSSSAANELGLANVGGVFVVLMGGMGVACVIAVCEFVWKSRKVAIEERVSDVK